MKIFQLDSGGESIKRDFTNHLETCGILHYILCLRTPDQNGFIERKHRQIVETSLTLLFRAYASKYSWVDVFAIAEFLFKRMLRKFFVILVLIKNYFQTNPTIILLKFFVVYVFLLSELKQIISSNKTYIHVCFLDTVHKTRGIDVSILLLEKYIFAYMWYLMNRKNSILLTPLML